MHANGLRKTLLGMAVLALTPLGAAISPANDLVISWSTGLETKLVPRFGEVGVTAVVLPWPGSPATAGFVGACRGAGITAIAELGAAKDLAEIQKAVDGARAAGFGAVALEAEGVFSDEKALGSFLGGLKGLEALVFLKAEQVDWRVAPAQAVLRAGQWPGSRGAPSFRRGDTEVASASREPWLDANSYLIAWLRGTHPERGAWLGYRPDEAAGVKKDRAVPYESLELALAEAYAAGGNVVLAVPEKYQAALAAGEESALSAWRALGQTARFLKQHTDTFRQPGAARVAVAAGTFEQSGEVLNMAYRRNACPEVFSARAVPLLDQSRFRVVVVANVPPPAGVNLKRVLGFAQGGGVLMAAPAAAGNPSWWLAPGARKIRSDEDRDVYSVGKGQVIAYREPVQDPSEFALDVIDALGVRTRDLRLWNASSVIGLLHRARGGPLAVTLINYGFPRTFEFPVRVEGVYQKATLTAPGGEPARQLKAVKRATGTEITVDRLGRLALIALE
jgi:hypothetical protein